MDSHGGPWEPEKDYSQHHPDNLVGHLIALEFCTTPDEMRQRIQRLHQQLKEPQYQQIRRGFAIWLSRLLRVRFKQQTIPEYQELNEVDAMLAERMTDWTLQWKKEGLEEGLKEGRKDEGIALVSRQLRRKLGIHPELEQILVQLPELSIETLEDLADALLDFNTLTDLESWLKTHGNR